MDENPQKTTREIKRRLSNARREIDKATKRATKLYEQGGELRRGHLIEAHARVVAIRNELDRFINQLAKGDTHE